MTTPADSPAANAAYIPQLPCLTGKLALITGASRGIGAAIAESLASKGASPIILNYTSDSSLTVTEELASSLAKKHHTKCIIVKANMGSTDGPSYLINTAKQQYSGTKPFQIDILINNAGVSTNTLLKDCTVEDYQKQYTINVLGPMLLTQAALPYLPKDRSGRIVNMSSVSSSEGFIEQTIYGGTKAALEAMTRTWARELAENATVNAVNPGPVLTDMYFHTTPEFKGRLKNFIMHTPLMAVRPQLDLPELVADADAAGGRPAYSSEIAGVVTMLCTPEAGWCTGQVICANGGMRMAM